MLHLYFVKESKHFITKVHYIVTKMLVLEKKADLQLVIQIDMKMLLEKTIYLTEMEALEAKPRQQRMMKLRVRRISF